MGTEKGDLLHGTLDMLVLKALQLEPMHGWRITERIEQWSEQVLQLGQGTLYPAPICSTGYTERSSEVQPRSLQRAGWAGPNRSR